MNKDRRKKIADAQSIIRNAIVELEAARDEEQEAFDNLSENLQQGERGEAMENAITCLSEAIDGIAEANDQLDQIE